RELNRSQSTPRYCKSKWNCANLMVATGEHIALRRGPSVGNQRFEAGQDVNASLAQETPISQVPLIQRASSSADQSSYFIQCQLLVRALEQSRLPSHKRSRYRSASPPRISINGERAVNVFT